MIIITPYLVRAQSNHYYRSKVLSIISDTTSFDSLTVVFNSVCLYNNLSSKVNDSLFSIDYNNALIISKHLRGAFSIVYKTFPVQLSKPYYNENNRFISLGTDTSKKIFTQTLPRLNNDNNGYIDADGSISRGISIGNNQDIIFNSDLNLQLTGRITDKIMLEGAISDNNIPIQPEGNSQQIQDFEKVYLRLYTQKQEAILGDYEIGNSENTFLKYHKKAQGVSLKNTSSNDRLVNSVSMAVSKGKTCRKSFIGMEGNQGPYRLTGCNNEIFIVVLSNTEKVFIDGRQMERGFEKDYTIDYNSGEIIFSANRMITKDSRIVVEFEYSDQNFARTLLVTENSIKTENTKTTISIVSENDNKNQSLNQTLNDEREKAMHEAGDNPTTINSAIKDTVWNANKVYYFSKDTIVNGETFKNIYQLSKNKATDIYSVSFSYVGDNNGDYIIDNNTVNGKSYRWISPEGTQKRGNYSPEITLIPPKSKQVISIKSEYGKRNSFYTGIEVSASNNDINTFSTIDDKDNNGFAINYDISKRWNLDSTSHYFETRFNQKIITKNYEAFDNYKDVEYTRNWNILSDNKFNEYINTFSIENKNRFGTLGYSLGLLKLETYQTGIQHQSIGNLNFGKLTIDYSISNMNAESKTFNSLYRKYLLTGYRSFRKSIFGLTSEQENNKIRQEDNALTLISNKFISNKVFFTKTDSSIWTYNLSVEKRIDFIPDSVSDNFIRNTDATNYKIQLALLKNYKNTLHVLFNYRTLKHIAASKSDHTYINKIEHQLVLFKKFITANTIYQFNSGMESKKAYTFVEVAQGMGYYFWDSQTDYNGNGKTDLNEFEIAKNKFQANYIKVQIPTNIYIPVFETAISENLTLSPKYLFKGDNSTNNFLSRFQNSLFIKNDIKTSESDLKNNINPFIKNKSDSLLVNVYNYTSNTLFFNKNTSFFSASINTINENSRTLTINGWENNTINKNTINNRIELTSTYTLSIKAGKETKSAKAETILFSNKNYDIKTYSLEPMLTWQPSIYTAFDIYFNYAESNNIEKEKAILKTLGQETRLSGKKNWRITAGCKYIYVTYNAESKNSLAYTILEGFLPGNNYSWNINIQNNLSKNLKASFDYSGIKTSDNIVLHVGSIQLSAYF